MLKRLLAPSATTHSVSFALFILRIWFGGLMVFLHGWAKAINFASLSTRFTDPYGLGPAASLSLSIGAELVCASLVVIGLGTRPAALILCCNMVTAFIYGHGMRLSGPGNGELAVLYLGVWVVLLIVGAGRYSLDGALYGRR
jgi:putative oxidoreductase